MAEQKTKESPKAIVVREPYPGSSKQSVRVVHGFADEVEAGVFAVEVAKPNNVLLDADRDYGRGKPIVAEVLTVPEELERRGYKSSDFKKAVQFRRDDIADREAREAAEVERKQRETAEAERKRAIAEKAEQLANEEREAARQRLQERATALVDGEE